MLTKRQALIRFAIKRIYYYQFPNKNTFSERKETVESEISNRKESNFFGSIINNHNISQKWQKIGF